MAIATSGNGLELMHTKLVARFVWVIAWVFYAVVLYFNGLYGLDVWKTTDFFLVTQTVMSVLVGFLPLVCRTPRMFVDVLSWFLPLFFYIFWCGAAFEWAQTGNGAVFWFYAPVMFEVPILLNFFRRYFLVAFWISIFVGYCALVPWVCATNSKYTVDYDAFAACLVRGYQSMAPLIICVGTCLVFVLLRQLVNYFGSLSAARASKEFHRHAHAAPSLYTRCPTQLRF